MQEREEHARRDRSLEALHTATRIINQRKDGLFTRLKKLAEVLPSHWQDNAVGCRICIDGHTVESRAVDGHRPFFVHEFKPLIATTGEMQFLVPERCFGPDSVSDQEKRLLESIARLVEETVVYEQNLGLFRRTFEAIREPVLIIDTSGDGRTIIDVNPAAERVFGYDRDELVGSTTEKLHVDSDRFAEFGGFDHELNQSGVLRASFPMRRKNGEVFEAEQLVSVIEPWIGLQSGAVSVIRDRAREKAREEKVRRSERRLRLIAEAINDAFWIMSADGKELEYMSPSFDELWGFRRQSVLDDIESWNESIVDEDIDVLRRRLDGPGEFEYRILRPDGDVRWMQDRTFPVAADDDAAERIVGVSKDITRRKNLEAMLQHSQKMDAVGRLASGIAHDFNNLLAVIMGGAEIIKSELPDYDPLAEEAEFVIEAAQRGAALTRKLLSFAGERAAEANMHDVAAVIRGMSGLLERSLPENIEIELEFMDVPLPILMNANELEQALLNLALNARDAMPDGGHLRIAADRESLRNGDAEFVEVGPGEYVHLTIEDTGTGMDEKTRERIFEPFFTTKSAGSGTGLGLAMVYGMVRKHGGAIEVSSEPGAGTRFEIHLPLHNGLTDEEREPEQEGSAAASAGLRIVVVEDESAVRRVVQRILDRAGHEVEVFETVEGARAHLEKSISDVDLVVSDRVLRDSRGDEFLAWVRERRRDLPCILMSGYAHGGRNGDRPLDRIEFLSKPFSHHDLLESVRNATRAVS